MIEVLDLSQRRKSPSPDACEPSQVTSPQLISASRAQNSFIGEAPLMLQSQQEAQLKPTTYFPILHHFQPEALRIVKPENLVSLGPNSCETLRFPLHPFGLERPKPIFEPQTNGIEAMNKVSGNFSESDDGISDTSSIITSATTQSKSPSPSTGSLYPKPVNREGKVTRPFKAYPRDPLAIAASLRPTDPESEERYNSFRKRLLDEIHAANGGQPTVTNPKMRRTHKRSSNEALNSDDTNRSSSNEDEYSKHPTNPNYSVSEHCDQSLNISTTSNSSNPEKGNAIKDSAYFERRRKNNAAAKKSRDRRRIKEDEIAIRAAFLERENMELRYELAIIRKQLAMCGVAPPSSLCT